MIKPPSQAPFAPVPKGLVQLFAFCFSLFSCPSPFFIFHFSFFISSLSPLPGLNGE
jgi:hypothetical protein